MSRTKSQEAEARVTTLLELVRAIADTGASEVELVATVTALVRTGRVRLVGSFCGPDVATCEADAPAVDSPRRVHVTRPEPSRPAA